MCKKIENLHNYPPITNLSVQETFEYYRKVVEDMGRKINELVEAVNQLTQEKGEDENQV